MQKIVIDVDVNNRGEAIDRLNEIVRQLHHGNSVGDGWHLKDSGDAGQSTEGQTHTVASDPSATGEGATIETPPGAQNGTQGDSEGSNLDWGSNGSNSSPDANKGESEGGGVAA